MTWPGIRTQTASTLWIEPHRIVAAAKSRPSEGLPDLDRLAQVLTELPLGPTSWILDDRWAPSLLIREPMELPAGIEAREAFFRWKFTQTLALDGAWTVQALDLGGGAWLLAGLPETQREDWIQLGARLQRPIASLVPRWLWAYNRLAPSRERPGMLLSLCPEPNGGHSGTLVAWGQQLCLLRHWAEPESPEGWWEARIQPSAAFLQRESRQPMDLTVLGLPAWPEGSIPASCFPGEIPAQEVL